MVHPGVVVVGATAVVGIGVLLYLNWEDFKDYFGRHHFDPMAAKFANREYRRQHDDDDDDSADGTSTSASAPHHGDYELRQRRTHPNSDTLHQNEKLDISLLEDREQKVREAEATMAASQARLDEMERQMKEREAAIREREECLQPELERSREQERMHEQELPIHKHQESSWNDSVAANSNSDDIGNNNDIIMDSSRLWHDDNKDSDQFALSSAVDSRAAHAILSHDLSSNHQADYNPFENSGTIFHTSSPNSSVQGDNDERSVTLSLGDEDGSEIDWTEAEVGSMGSHDSYESWASPGSP
ncbi:hypothetical protein BGZ94_007296 [Podila epigama]|nr:hypothetical protein BGZ94_007296 [Podila epigama]